MENKEDLWWDYGIETSSKLSCFHMDWSKITAQEREVAALWKLEADIGNGGFLQFFCNWGYEAYQYAIKALESIKALQSLEIVIQSYAVIARLENEDMETIWDIPKLLTETEAEKLSQLDKRFWEGFDSENISKLAYDYYCQ